MKKRLLSLFLTFSMLLTFFPVGTVTVFASDSPMAYTDGSYQFILNADNTATITKYTGNERRITIPAQVAQGTQTYPVSKKRFHDYHQVSQCELYHRFFLYRFFYLLFSYTYQSDLKEESSNIFHYNCYLQNNSSVVYFVFYFLSNMDPTYPKKSYL